MIDTIIFDAEGVIVDTEMIWDKGQEEFLKRKGYKYDRERIKHLLTGRSLREGVLILKKVYGIHGDPEELANERIEIVKEFFEHEVDFVQGFDHFYKSVRNRYKTCIATSMNEKLLELINRRLGLFKLFEGKVYTLADVGYRSKPNADIFLFAAEQLISKPENCVVIEDSPLGIEAAKKAKMKCIGLTTTYDWEKLKKADIIVDTFSDINLKFL